MTSKGDNDFGPAIRSLAELVLSMKALLNETMCQVDAMRMVLEKSGFPTGDFNKTLDGIRQKVAASREAALSAEKDRRILEALRGFEGPKQ